MGFFEQGQLGRGTPSSDRVAFAFLGLFERVRKKLTLPRRFDVMQHMMTGDGSHHMLPLIVRWLRDLALVQASRCSTCWHQAALSIGLPRGWTQLLVQMKRRCPVAAELFPEQARASFANRTLSTLSISHRAPVQCGDHRQSTLSMSHIATSTVRGDHSHSHKSSI